MTSSVKRPAALILAAFILHLVLIQPNHPGALSLRALTLFTLELPAILCMLAFLPAPQRFLRGMLVAALAVLALLKGADFGFVIAFNRGFDVVTDRPLLFSAWQLGTGALGVPLTLLAILGGVLLIALGAAALWWATGQWVGVARGQRLVLAAAGLAMVLVVADIGQAMRTWALPFQIPGAAFTARTGVERVIRTRKTLRDLATFRADLSADIAVSLAAPLSRLTGREVLVVFVESYGRASIDNPLYAPAHMAVLTAAEDRIATSGLAIRTGWLTSPIEGGQSWLAHATLASGLSIGNQMRHNALLASPRRTIWQVAQRAGYRTAAVSPAITLPWPEATRLGFDLYLDRNGMDYAGAPFNWITMPDQFTLARFRDRLPPDPRPLFAQVTLISSHAPWVPVPDVLPWDQIGDGTEFNTMATRGDTPAVVWRDRDRVRTQYRDSISYSLTVAFDWAAQQNARAEPPLILILGDHPPASFVSQVGNRDVPAHLIAPQEVLAMLDDWGWTPGLIPTPDTPRWPMQDLRDRFLTSLSGPNP
jgi:Sulfatase